MAFIINRARIKLVDIKEAIREIDHFVFVEPGLLAKSILRNFRKRRTAPLADLRIKKDKFCVWCNVMEIKPPKHRYCSDMCRDSAFMYCNPQSPTTKGFMFIQRQQCACAGCGMAYEYFIKDAIRQFNENKPRKRTYETDLEFEQRQLIKVSYHYIFNNTGHFIQVDHIKPISQGGSGIGLDNVQVLCVECHINKTRRENENYSNRK